MTKRVILPAEADEKMMLAGMAMAEMMASATQGDAIIAGFDAMRDASPNAGMVTEAELEAMLAAKPFDDGDETVEKIIVLGLAACGFKLPTTAAPDVLRAALASLGLEVEG